MRHFIRLGARSAAAALLVMTASPAFARHELPLSGSSGDAGAKAECPAGQTLVGFSGRTGVWIDAIQMVCAPPGGQPVALGPVYGGAGGRAVDSFCQKNWRLTRAVLNLTTRNRQIATITYVCQSRATGERADFFIGNPTYMARCPGPGLGCDLPTNTIQNCDDDEEPIGFNVRYGKDVNGFGLICGRAGGLR